MLEASKLMELGRMRELQGQLAAEAADTQRLAQQLTSAKAKLARSNDDHLASR